MHTPYLSIDEFGHEVLLGTVIKRMLTIESVGSRELASQSESCPLSSSLSECLPTHRHSLLCPFPSHPQNALRLSPRSILPPSDRPPVPGFQCLLSLRHNLTHSAPTQVTPITVSPPLYRVPKRSPVRRAASQPAHTVVFLLHFCTAQVLSCLPTHH